MKVSEIDSIDTIDLIHPEIHDTVGILVLIHSTSFEVKATVSTTAFYFSLENLSFILTYLNLIGSFGDSLL